MSDPSRYLCILRWLLSLGAALFALSAAAQQPEVQVRQVAVIRPKDNKTLLLAAALSRDGKRLACCDAVQGASIWSAETGKGLRRLLGYARSTPSVAFSPDGKRVVTGGDDKTVRIWSAVTGKELKRMFGHAGRIDCVIFSPTGRSVLSATVSRDNPTIRLWNVSSGREVHRYMGHTDGVQALAFTPDSKKFVSGGWDSSVRLWAVSGKQLHTFEGHTGPVLSVAVSPDGKRILSGGADNTIRLWDIEKGQEIWKADEPMGAVYGVAFLPDGKHAITAGGGTFKLSGQGANTVSAKLGKAAVRLWDLDKGKEIQAFEPPRFAVVALGLSANGRRVMAGCIDGNVYIWELPDLKTLPGGAGAAKKH
jgi:WD40 repeat protein